MDPSCSELEFFDFSNAPEEEIKEIREILKLSRSNGFVEFPWDIPFAEEYGAIPLVADQSVSNDVDTPSQQKSANAVMGQALLYTFPHPSVSSTPVAHPQPMPTPTPLQNPDVLPVEAYISPSGVPLPAVTTISHFPSAPPYVLPRTYPYMRTYPHLGVPLFTCTLPGSGEIRDVNTLQAPYGQFMPLTAAVPQMDKHMEVKSDADLRPKARPLDKQYNRRNKKKHPTNNFYGSDMVSSDSFQEPVVAEDQMSASLQGPIDITSDIPSVTSSVPLVPLAVPPSTFAVTSGAIPLHGYPPGLHTLPYPQMSGPQTPSAPVYYVPVFNHPHYASYIPSPTSGPLMLPMGVGSIHPIGETNCSLESIVAANCSNPISPEISENIDSLSLTLERNTKSASNIDPDAKLPISAESCEKFESSSMPLASPEEKNVDSNFIPSGNSNILHETVSKLSMNYDCGEGHSKIEEPREVCPDGTRCWADLFKKRCSEVNGLDQQFCTADNDSVNGHNLNKDCNGKLYSVPASEDIV